MMKWARETPHMLTSNEGYKIGRYKVGDQVFYRPSRAGDFISRPFTDLDAAKAECDRHFEGGAKA
ncbi:MAG TPA: hypothetical protein VN653_05560 [Anaerolineales bacterium]|nr:hypothetical protein [Anaerolineales bacterium]